MENDPLFYALASLARDQFPNDVDELDDMARVFLVLCRGVKAYAAVWEAQDLQTAIHNAEAPAEEQEAVSLGSFINSTRVAMTIQAIHENCE